VGRPAQYYIERLDEQARFLRRSLGAFYAGDLEEAVRVAVVLRTLVHDTPKSRALLRHLRGSYRELEILDMEHPVGEVFLHLAVGMRIGPGTVLSPSVDLGAMSYRKATLGDWWEAPVIEFVTRLGGRRKYTRKMLALILANKEGGAHVDANEDLGYTALLEGVPLSFVSAGSTLPMPNLARYSTAQSGAELLKCVCDAFGHRFKKPFEVPLEWEAPVPSGTLTTLLHSDAVTLTAWRGLVAPPFPQAAVSVGRREGQRPAGLAGGAAGGDAPSDER
jgi:hypothetical protein